MRAIRFASTYGFEIEPETKKAIHQNRHLLKNVSAERKTVEFVKMLVKANADLLIEYADVFAEFIPEIKPMIGFDQKSPWHMYDVFTHTAKAVELAPQDSTIRLAVFFHDIGKPYTFQEHIGRGHFPHHGDKSQELVEKIMKYMRFDTSSIKDVSVLVKHHDDPLVHNIETPNLKLLLNQFGEENLRRLVKIQLADHQAQRGTKEQIAQIPTYQMPFEEKQIFDQLSILETFDKAISDVLASGEPYRIKDLAINGNDLIEMGMKPGKEIKDVLNSLLLDVVNDPTLNTKEILLNKANELYKHFDNELDSISQADIGNR
jgi:tRNA nucleotidyltransferase (CCA-adding enzyme)